MADLAVVILTYNEERHIARAIEAVAGVAREIVVVDSFSTDRTVELARLLGATVLQNKFVNYAKQFQWALDNAALSASWVMRLDADEIVESDLAREIEEKLPQLGSDVAGINLKRKHIFLGKWVRHGGRFPLILLRIWRRGQGRIENRWMDEHMIVWGGRTVTFEGGFADHNLNDLTFFTDKHNKYATREAIDILNQRRKFLPLDGDLSSNNASFQAAAKRFVKEKIYNAIPFSVSVPMYFLYRWIFQLGFLDGIEGFIYHFLQGFWYRFLVGAKVLEFERATVGIDDPNELRIALSRLSGLNLS